MPSELRPICIGPSNCKDATGMSWRHVRDHMNDLGLAFVSVGKKRVILASQLLESLERRAASQAAAAEPSEEDELAAMRERVRRAG